MFSVAYPLFSSPQPWLSPIADGLLEAIGPLEEPATPLLAGVKCSIYRSDAYRESFPSLMPFSQRFVTFSGLLSALSAAEATALETALELLKEVDLASAERIALQLLSHQPWQRLRDGCCRVLGRCDSQASFEALLRLLGDTFVAGYELSQNRFAGGCALVMAALGDNAAVQNYRSVPLVRVDDWLALGTEGQRAWQRQVEHADDAYPQEDREVAESLMSYAGTHGCDGSVAVAKRLYADHPSRELRLACGHALVDAGELDFLAGFVSFAEATAQRFGVLATIKRAPETAVTALGDFTNTDAREPVDVVLDVLEFQARDNSQSAWIRADPGWLDSLVAWSKRRALRDVVLSLLEQHFSPAEITAAQARHNQAKPVAAPKPPVRAAAGKLLSDYQNGRHAAVWNKLIRLDTQVREATVLSAAREVAAEIMKRFAESLDHLVEALRAEGYVLREPASARLQPHRDVAVQLERAESLVGPLPLSLFAAYQIVGSCDLRGRHPAWKSCHVDDLSGPDEKVAWLTDALVLPPLADLIDQAEDQADNGRLRYVFGGDDMSKAGYSGGVYEVSLPDPVADAVLLGEPKDRRLVDYLRRSVKFGGFAGFAAIRARPKKLIEHVTQRCLAF